LSAINLSAIRACATRSQVDLCRFLQPDPIGVADNINLYAYTGNDPLNYVDPTGEAGKLADYAWGTSEDPRPLQMSYNWATGSGPLTYEFGPDSVNTIEMMTAPDVSDARDYLYNKYEGAPPEGGYVTNYGVSFGFRGLFTADTLAEQFVGSYRIDIDVSNGQANFSLGNNSSFTSFAQSLTQNVSVQFHWVAMRLTSC
jgi:hypothetical protein